MSGRFSIEPIELISPVKFLKLWYIIYLSKKKKKPILRFHMQQAARVLGYVNLHIFMNSKKVPCHNNFYLKNSALNSRMESMWKLINFPLYLSLMSGFSALKQGPRKRQNDIKSSGALVPLEAPERATSPLGPTLRTYGRRS